MEEQKPQKPLTGYFQFQQEHAAEIQHMGISERSKYISEKWNALPEEEKKERNAKQKALTEQYKLDLAAYYERHPDVKKKDEELAQEKKAKKLQAKEPPGLKADEKNIKTFFYVAYLKKYREQNKPDYLPCENAVKRLIQKGYKKLVEDGKNKMWAEKWTNLTVEQR